MVKENENSGGEAVPELPAPKRGLRLRKTAAEKAADKALKAEKAGKTGKLAKVTVSAPVAATAHVNAAEPTVVAAEPVATAPKSRSTRTASTKADAASTGATTSSTSKTSAAKTGTTKSGTARADATPPAARPTTSLLFQAPPAIEVPAQRSGSRQPAAGRQSPDSSEENGSVRRRSRRRPGEEPRDGDDAPNTVVRVRQPRPEPVLSNEPTRVKGSTRLEAKKQRRRDGRDAGRRRPVITESEFLARRESVDRAMVVRSRDNRIQIAVLEDGVLVEHYVAKSQDMSLIGNVYLGRVQNVLPSMEAAFVDIGRGRNAVLYSGEVDWDAAAAENEGGKNQARRIELALKPGDRVLVQVTKDPVGHKGARLTSQISLPGRYLVYVPNGSMNGISRKLPDTERSRLKKILKEVLPENTGVIVRTAAEGATEDQLTLDVQRLTNQWAEISRLVETAQAPALLHSEPDLLVKIIRDVFNEDFHKLVIAGSDAQETIEAYLRSVAPDLIDRVQTFEGTNDPFDEYRVNEQIEKALDRKVWLPSGGSLVIDRTEAMTVVDVNTGKFVGSGGNLEETVTKNNLEAAEEIVRQLRLRDIGGIIVVDFIDMVLESNRDLVLRRLVECLSRDRTKHQVAEVTSLGLVQMTRKKLGLGLLETFSEPCETCAGRGVIVHHDPVNRRHVQQQPQPEQSSGNRRGRGRGGNSGGNGNNGGNGNSGNNSGGNNSAQRAAAPATGGTHAITDDVRNALARVAASTVVHSEHEDPTPSDVRVDPVTTDSAADASSDAPATESNAHQGTSKSNSSRGNSAKGRSSKSRAAKEAPAADAPAASVVDAGASAGASAGEALDMPAQVTGRAPRKARPADADVLLGSVLEALPEPKQPGQGRRGSRRAGSAGNIVSAPVTD